MRDVEGVVRFSKFETPGMRPPVPLHALCVLLSVASLSHAVYLKGSVQAPPPALSLVLAATGGADGSWDALLRPHVVQWGRVHPASTDATMEVIIVVTEDALAEVREAVAVSGCPLPHFSVLVPHGLCALPCSHRPC